MKKRRRNQVLLAMMLSNLVCCFGAAHGIVFTGLVEGMSLGMLFRGDLRYIPYLWMLVTILVLTGQVLIIRCFFMDEKRWLGPGKLASILMSAGFLLMFFLFPYGLLLAAVLTWIPYVLVTIFFWSAVNRDAFI